MAYFIGLSGYSALWRWVCRCPVWLTAFRFLYASDFYRLGYIKDGSFCSGMRRPLRRPSEYTSWRSRSTVPPYMFSGSQKENVSLSGLVCFMFEKKYWLKRMDCDTVPRSFSQRTLLCGGLEDKTCFFFFYTHNGFFSPQTRPPESIIFNMCYSWKEQRWL